MIQQKRQYLDIDIKFLLGNTIVNVLYINYEPPRPSWTYSNHAHSSYELHFIPSGKGLLRVGQEKYDISPRSFYLTGPGLYHQQEAALEEPMCEYCINFELKRTKRQTKKSDVFLQSEVDEIAAVFEKTNFWFGIDHYSLSDLCIEVMQEIDQRDLGCYTLVQNLVSELIVKVARTISGKPYIETSLPKKITNDRRRLMADLFFLSNSSSSPEMLANRLGVSLRQLNRIMLDYYSMTFKEKQTSQRIEYAKSLLLSTDLPIHKIAEKAGYTNIGHFCKVFKENVGETPTDFRSILASQAGD